MKFAKVFLIAVSLSLPLWCQATPQANPSAQPSQQNAPAVQNAPAMTAGSGASAQSSATPASSSRTSISGCMQESWGRFLVRDNASSATYNVFAGGQDLTGDANHVVSVTGVPDAKDAQGNIIPFYAQSVQNTGQTCGQVAAAQSLPVTGETGNKGTAMNATTTSQRGVTPGWQTPAAWQAANAANSDQNGNTKQPPSSSAQASGASSSMSSPAGQPQMNGAATTPGQPSEAEKKGTPESGTPSAVASPAGAASGPSASAASGQNFVGCLSGNTNQFSLTTNGVSYALEGNTNSLSGLSGHEVEVTGEVAGGNAIQVSTARDLGRQCSQK